MLDEEGFLVLPELKPIDVRERGLQCAVCFDNIDSLHAEQWRKVTEVTILYGIKYWAEPCGHELPEHNLRAYADLLRFQNNETS